MSFAEKIKALFSEETEQEIKVETVETEVTETEQKFLDVAVGDRTFRTDTEELVEGSYIFEVVIEEVDGEMVETIKKVEDGEYTLNDGTVIMVEADVVVMITPAAEEEVAVEEEAPAESEFESTVFDSFEKLKLEIENLSKINADLKSELASIKEDFSNKLEEIKKLPGGEAVTFKKQGFKFNSKKENDYARLKDLSQYRK